MPLSLYKTDEDENSNVQMFGREKFGVKNWREEFKFVCFSKFEIIYLWTK